jgi:gamma-glutamylaminecyclotransferase
MRGFSNHHVVSGCRYLGEARTVSKYSLYVGSYPFVNSSIEDTYVYGELYEVEHPDDLLNLDRLEGHPDFYCRTDCSVRLDGAPDDIFAQIYFYDSHPTEGSEHVRSGTFKDSAVVKKYILN